MFHIFSKDIALEIDGFAGFSIAQVGVFISVRNHGNFDCSGAQIPGRDGKTDAVNGDGAFGDNIAGEFLRDLDAEPPIVAVRALGIEAGDAACAVNVALHEVAAEFLAGGQRLLEIDARTFPQPAGTLAEGRLPNCFAGQIGGKRIFAESDDGQAAPIYSDAVGNGENWRKARCADGDAAAGGAQLERVNGPNVFDDAGKQDVSTPLEAYSM